MAGYAIVKAPPQEPFCQEPSWKRAGPCARDNSYLSSAKEVGTMMCSKKKSTALCLSVSMLLLPPQDYYYCCPSSVQGQ